VLPVEFLSSQENLQQNAVPGLVHLVMLAVLLELNGQKKEKQGS